MIRDFCQELLDQKIINPESLKKIESSNTSNASIIYKLLSSGLINENNFYSFYKSFCQTSTINLKRAKLPVALLKSFDGEVLRKYYALPIIKVKNRITMAMADPLDYQAIEAIEKLTNNEVNPIMAPYSEIVEILDREFGVVNTVKMIMEDLASIDFQNISITSLDQEIFQTSASAGPINRLLHLVISHALREKASDIHFEPGENELQCRFRIDGVLYKFISFPKSIISSVISSLKILGKMDIAEKRIPLDGSFQVRIDSRVIDIRVSSFPTSIGEKIALRILDKDNFLISLNHIGFTEKMLTKFSPLIEQNSGIILVTGPTGSGKTTTLYATLEKIKSIEKNIVTIEDPIEYHLEMINQSQVNIKSGLTFARGLRSFLRQDPDIILVGEIRDGETAEIAFQAALTGHLVFSTLHTNDAPAALTRLRDMGIENYLLSSSTINAILAQRLARRTCPYCQKKYIPDPELLRWLNIKPYEDHEFYQGTGCDRCKGSGYLGRIALFELLIPDANVNNMIFNNDLTADHLKQSVLGQSNFISFMEDASEKVLSNKTTIDEVYRVLR